MNNHDVVLNLLLDRLQVERAGWRVEWPDPGYDYWVALQHVIDGPDFDDADELVKIAAYAAVEAGDLNPPASLCGPF